VNVPTRKILDDGKHRRFCLIFILLSAMPLAIIAGTEPSRVILKPTVSATERAKLESKLALITGWKQLRFNERGELAIGEQGTTTGSAIARDLVKRAVFGENVIVVEPADNRLDVVFCKIVPGVWTKNSQAKPPAYVLMIDFNDFDRLIGDRLAESSFNVGWAVLHEFVHVVNDSVDPEEYGEVGACESIVNQMRRELGVAERGEYFYTQVPGQSTSVFRTVLVRLAFDEAVGGSGKKKRHWLVWDASVVGGLPRNSQVATLR
jgi:hypothetical protein